MQGEAEGGESLARVEGGRGAEPREWTGDPHRPPVIWIPRKLSMQTLPNSL